ncbi:unnamed protein product [Urochloa humidicola]
MRMRCSGSLSRCRDPSSDPQDGTRRNPLPSVSRSTMFPASRAPRSPSSQQLAAVQIHGDLSDTHDTSMHLAVTVMVQP